MKWLLIFSIIIFSVTFSYAQSPNWLWAKSAGSLGADKAHAIALDAYGNAYIAGYGGDIYALGGFGCGDIFLAKYDVNGNVLWAKNAGGYRTDEAYSVVVDASGYVYLVGYFWSPTIVFGSITLTNENANGGTADIFLAKYDNDGNVLWAKSEGGLLHDVANYVVTDASGNVYVVGHYESQSITFDSTLISNNGYSDIFLTKYDTNGNVLWAKGAGSYYFDNATSVTLDTLCNIYITGSYYSPISFDSITLTNTTVGADIFLTKYDTNGNVLWAKSAGGYFEDIASSIKTDYSGNIFISGYYRSPNIIFGLNNLANAGNTNSTNDIFLAKYDFNGNVLWAKRFGGSIDDMANCITIDSLGNAYLAGNFKSYNIIFDTTTLINYDSTSSSDIFIAKFDANGNVIWAKNIGSSSNDFASSIAVDVSGNAYLAGYYSSPTLTLGSTILTNEGEYDLLIAKLNNVIGVNELSNTLGGSIYPNPTNGKLTITLTDKINSIEIFNLLGEIIFSLIPNKYQTTAEINLTQAPKGIYIVKVDNGEKVQVEKVVLN